MQAQQRSSEAAKRVEDSNGKVTYLQKKSKRPQADHKDPSARNERLKKQAPDCPSAEDRAAAASHNAAAGNPAAAGNAAAALVSCAAAPVPAPAAALASHAGVPAAAHVPGPTSGDTSREKEGKGKKPSLTDALLLNLVAMQLRSHTPAAPPYVPVPNQWWNNMAIFHPTHRSQDATDAPGPTGPTDAAGPTDATDAPRPTDATGPTGPGFTSVTTTISAGYAAAHQLACNPQA